MKIAVVGSREYPWEYLVRGFVRSLPASWEIVSGGARGVDRWAIDEAKLHGRPFYEFLPKDRSTQALFARNAEIAYDCDVMVGFMHDVSSGTVDAIRRVQKLEKPYFVVNSAAILSHPPTVEQILVATGTSKTRSV